MKIVNTRKVVYETSWVKIKEVNDEFISLRYYNVEDDVDEAEIGYTSSNKTLEPSPRGIKLATPVPSRSNSLRSWKAMMDGLWPTLT